MRDEVRSVLLGCIHGLQHRRLIEQTILNETLRQTLQGQSCGIQRRSYVIGHLTAAQRSESDPGTEAYMQPRRAPKMSNWLIDCCPDSSKEAGLPSQLNGCSAPDSGRSCAHGRRVARQLL